MANMVMISGVEEIADEMKEWKFAAGKRFYYGLTAAGLFLQRMSQKIVPVDTANLKNSAGTRAIGFGFFTDVVVYYTASYAVYVHERMDLKHKEGKQAKFLEAPARLYKRELLGIIRKGGK